MKYAFLLLLLAACLLAPILPAAAQQPPPQKIATVDLKKVFDSYWKTKQADSNLKDSAVGFDKERKSLVDLFLKTQEAQKKLTDGANDQAVSAEERDKRKKAAEAELIKLQEMQKTIREFDAQAKTMLNEQQRRMRDNILIEIKDAIKAKAKSGNYSFVFDSAGESINSTPVMIYNTGDNDLTDAVLTQLNLTAPAGFKPVEVKPPKP